MSEFLKVMGAIIGGLGVVLGVITGFQTQEAASYLDVEGIALYIPTITYIVSGIISWSILTALGMILETVQDIKKQQEKNATLPQNTVTESV